MQNSIKDSITHCGVAVVNSLPLQWPLIRVHCKSTKKNPLANNFKIAAKNSSVITIERFLIQNFANYQMMAEIQTDKNRLRKSLTELEKVRQTFSSLFSLARAYIMGDIAPLKEQYPVTAHAPNFYFWIGCREIKRCEENIKRTLKNPFALHLGEFNTTLKLLRITDQ